MRLIEQAKKRILLAGYGFTSNEIAKAIKEAHARGVIVHLVLDKSNSTSKYSRAIYLANAGVDVRINSRYANQLDFSSRLPTPCLSAVWPVGLFSLAQELGSLLATLF